MGLRACATLPLQKFDKPSVQESGIRPRTPTVKSEYNDAGRASGTASEVGDVGAGGVVEEEAVGVDEEKDVEELEAEDEWGEDAAPGPAWA